MNLRRKLSVVVPSAMLAAALTAQAGEKSAKAAAAKACVDCHRKQSAALVMEWERSRHGQAGIGCADCHAAKQGEPDAWLHEGAWVSALVTPKDCAQCHDEEYKQFSRSHHARAGEILASLDNVLAEKAAGKPGNIADAVNGCWQCHGAIIKFQRDSQGNILRSGKEGKPVIDPMTWPNSGMGRLNPDGSKGSCHACHSRHSFDAKLARAPENCGKCHMGPDHPQLEIYNESKHGIAFHANRDKMALDKSSDWVLGKDYSAAPTCATCHIASYNTPDGKVRGNTHDVGERISWTLRPVVSSKLNLVIYNDGYKENLPESKLLPKVGDTVQTSEQVVENEKLVAKTVPRKVAKVVTWQERRQSMKGVCFNCHNQTFVDNFYRQFDDLVVLYNDKFAKPAQALMNDLQSDGLLNPKAPFEHDVQWIFYELWHHEGRRARHGASMMGPDYTHWHGMYEVAKHFYTKFLPAVLKTAAAADDDRSKRVASRQGTIDRLRKMLKETSDPAAQERIKSYITLLEDAAAQDAAKDDMPPAPAAKSRVGLKQKYEKKIQELLAREEHVWLKGLKPEEAEALRKSYKDRYNQ